MVSSDYTAIFSEPTGELQDARVVGDDQHAASLIPGDLRQQRHHGPAVLGVQRGGRLVRENDRWISNQRAGNGNTLLLATAQLAGI